MASPASARPSLDADPDGYSSAPATPAGEADDDSKKRKKEDETPDEKAERKRRKAENGYNARQEDLTLEELIEMMSRSQEESRKYLEEVLVKKYVTEYEGTQAERDSWISGFKSFVEATPKARYVPPSVNNIGPCLPVSSLDFVPDWVTIVMFINCAVKYMRRECGPSSMLQFEKIADAVDLIKKYCVSTYGTRFNPNLGKAADMRIGMNPGIARKCQLTDSLV